MPRAARSVEFGAKLSIGHQKSGYVTVDTLSWDACNESGDLTEQIESCKPLGWPRKASAEELRAQSRQRRQDEVDRIPVEGKFGNAKRKGTLDRVMPKLAHASESAIHVAIVAMNLDTWLRAILFWLLRVACAIAGVPLARLGRSLAAHAGGGYSNAPPKLARL